MAIAYLKLDGIEGESDDARFKGWIPLDSVSFSDRGMATGAGGGGSGQRSLNSMHLSKRVDNSSVGLQRACVTGQPFAQALIQYKGAPPGGGMPVIVLTNVLISNCSFSGQGGEAIQALTLNFTEHRTMSVAEFAALGLISGALRSVGKALGRRP